MARLIDHLFRSSKTQRAYALSPLAVQAERREAQARAYMRHRRARMETQAGQAAAEALRLLPLLLHVNMPGLPGHVDDRACPAGIADYSPTSHEIKLARRLFPGARVRRAGFLRPAVDLVAVMGSAGTIGFTGESDLDVWICHGPHLREEALALYRRKVRALEAWACDHAGADIHLFFQSTASIRANDFGQTDVEGCGSAMGALLKEEFYRTGILLAGKLPYWWVVPPGLDPGEHREHLERLRGDPTLVTDGYADLGPVARVPLGELFGAALWQIVKGWKAPFKSALKMGLLEKAVCSDAPVPPLCETLKEQVQAGERPDPYCLLFDAVLDHYRATGDAGTEDLLARCFYLKSGIRLDPGLLEAARDAPGDLGVMARYVASWGWGPRRVEHLNGFRHWRFQWVRQLGREVDRFFLRTYQRIRSALDRTGETQRITPRDLTVLGRKLQVMYRRLPDKVETIHLPTHVPEESSLTLFQETLPSGEAPWKLFRGRVTPSNADERYADVLREGADPLEILVWAAHNGILGPRTEMTCWAQGARLSGSEATQAARHLAGFMARARDREPPLEALLEAPRVLRMIVVPNLGVAGPTVRELGEAHVTSWGEVFYRRWTGAEALGRFMEEAFVPLLLDGAGPEALRVLTPVRKVGGIHSTSHRLERRLPAMMEFMGGRDHPGGVRRRYVAGSGQGCCVLDRTGPRECRYHSFYERGETLRHLSGVGPYVRVETRVEREAGDLALLATLFEVAEHGRLDVFVLREGATETLFVVDEVGNLSYFEAPADPQPYSLAKLLHFIENVYPEVAGQPHSPLAGLALEDALRIHTLVYDGTCRAFTATQDHLSRVRSLGLVPVGLTIERTYGPEGEPAGYRVTWGMQVIRSGEHPNPLAEVRRRILSARRSGVEYDAFVTRLFLDDAFRATHCGPFAALGHYLFYKKAIEQRLSA